MNFVLGFNFIGDKLMKSKMPFIFIAQFILLILTVVFSVQAAGEVDPAFNPGLIDVDYVFYSESIERTNVRRVVVQPDGKILATGIFNVVNQSLRDSIVRFNADGTLECGRNARFFVAAVYGQRGQSQQSSGSTGRKNSGRRIF
jgi:hypothetical protein